MNTLIAMSRGANTGPIWGRQDPGGPHVGPMNLAVWDRYNTSNDSLKIQYDINQGTYIIQSIIAYNVRPLYPPQAITDMTVNNFHRESRLWWMWSPPLKWQPRWCTISPIIAAHTIHYLGVFCVTSSLHGHFCVIATYLNRKSNIYRCRIVISNFFLKNWVPVNIAYI